MAEAVSSNKRLAKNTLAMYFRMLFLMFIGFYTSRVVLKALGEVDFGIYNIVGGVIVLFTFVNGAMTTGTQRHLSYELGKPDGNIARIFSACFNIHIWLSIGIVILAETIGLWFLNTQMNFPSDRMEAVNWVYQLSIASCVFSIIRIPYNAAIIAYEKMSFYAYIGILEGILKLGVAFMIIFSGLDKLIVYTILLLLVAVLVTVVYAIYCYRKFSEIRHISIKDYVLYKYLLSFSGWTIFGSVANIARGQGVNIIINIFYGVTLNAAIGIANQVNSAINQFVCGFQQAFNPQLTKAEAKNEKESQTSLICSTAKYSYLIMLFCAVPLLFNFDYVLTIWLDEYPSFTKEICLWIIIATLIDSLSGPLWVTIFATGTIKKYQIVISSLLLLNLPLTYFCGKFGWQPQYGFAFQALLNLIAVFVRLYFMKRIICFRISTFCNKVLIPLFIVTLIICALSLTINKVLTINNVHLDFITNASAIVIVESIVIWFVGFTGSERNTLSQFVRSKIH